MGLSCGFRGRTIWIVDAHGYGKRFIVRADEKLTAFVELERAIYKCALGVGRGRGVGVHLPVHRVGVGVDVAVAFAVAVGVAVAVAVAVAVGVGKAVGVGVGVGAAAQYLPPLFNRLPLALTLP